MIKLGLTTSLSLSFIFAMSSGSAFGGDNKTFNFDVSPTVLESDSGGGSTIGIEYKFSDTLLSIEPASDGSLDSGATINKRKISYKGSGTVAADQSRNPKDFMEFSLNADQIYSHETRGEFLFGFFLKYESDQRGEEKQSVSGLSATYGKFSALTDNDFVSLDVKYGQVDPVDDTTRQAALAIATLLPYYRWNAEVLYMFPVDSRLVRGIEVNYRVYLEDDAPAAIKTSNLDVHQLSSARISLPQDFYLAYSDGKLPFDRKDDQSVQLGFSYKLK